MGIQSTIAVQARRQFPLIAAILTSIFLMYFFLPLHPSSFPFPASLSSLSSTPKHKHAYVAFLAPYTKATGQSTSANVGEEDHYLVGIRMLLYQLLHDPITRTTTHIPFIVLVTQSVPQSDRDRLTRDGATVIEVEKIKLDWIKPGRERWMDVMDKLHVFELVQYEKVLLLDADTVIVKPLDAIFADPATELSENLGKPESIHADEAAQPSQYIMAGNCGPSGKDHPYPSPRCTHLNAGFVILKPSLSMYAHYISIAFIPGRFDSEAPEQNLWNYVHDMNGNMPWKQIDPDWTANTPVWNDYRNGIRSFHEKYWGCGRDRKLRDVLLRSRWKMEGFLDARDYLLDNS
jgi:alpha-N-acetylglucosamine transferase